MFFPSTAHGSASCRRLIWRSGEHVTTDSEKLKRELRDAGLSDDVVSAAWPSWWSDELADDPSGRAELRYALARRLGLSPKSLMGERVRFIWNEEARFKNLSINDMGERAALSSFGVTIGRLLLRATPCGPSIEGVDATSLREAMLSGRAFVDLNAMLGTCWVLGIPVIHLRVFPLDTKSMHAMVVTVEGRYAILLGHDARYPASVAFTLAHEMGHAALCHLVGVPALVDMEDPAKSSDADDQEAEADRFALTLLTGRPDPVIATSNNRFNAPTLARAVLGAAEHYGIEPGTLALCLAHQRGAWRVAQAAMRFIYDQPRDVWRNVNSVANSQLDWSSISDDTADWIHNVMGERE